MEGDFEKALVSAGIYRIGVPAPTQVIDQPGARPQEAPPGIDVARRPSDLEQAPDDQSDA